ncbi:MAG: hypothetical protein JW951_03560 [Lentisphaerae bacterium]|nr:hypothetical protein [Lentisphaerota bacterium]
METVEYNGWPDCVRLSNGDVELIVTRSVGPRIIRCGFIGERNLFAEIEGQQGGSGETDWMIRGGHRLWLAPEEKPKTYEPDNVPVEIEEIADGVRTLQPPGPLAHTAKTMEITLAPGANTAEVAHILTNRGEAPIELAPWALTVMAPGGRAIVPLPDKIPHTERVLPNQAWVLWAYTDLSDPRWTFGSRHLFFDHDAARGPNKIGIAHREGWAAYWLDGFTFVKRFERKHGEVYLDGGANFQTFANEKFLEVESLGPVVTLEPEQSIRHVERWSLHRDIPPVDSDAAADAHIRPIAAG